MDASRTTKWSILNERLRNPDPAVLVSHAVDIYLLKNPTANTQPLDLLVTIDGERTASGEKSLLTRALERSVRLTAATPGKWAGQTARCRPRGWCTSPARPEPSKSRAARAAGNSNREMLLSGSPLLWLTSSIGHCPAQLRRHRLPGAGG